MLVKFLQRLQAFLHVEVDWGVFAQELYQSVTKYDKEPDALRVFWTLSKNIQHTKEISGSPSEMQLVLTRWIERHPKRGCRRSLAAANVFK